MTETDEYVKRTNEILENLTYINNESFTKKKSLIIQLKEMQRPLVLAGFYPDVSLDDLCSFIGNLLLDNHIEYSSGHLAELFDDDEKRTQHRSKNSPHRGVMDSPPPQQEQGIIGQLDFMEKQIGKSYDVMPDYHAADKLFTLEQIANKSVSHIKTFTRKLFTANYYINSFEKQFGDVDQADKTLETLPKKQKIRLNSLIAIYHSSILLISEMESNLVDIKTNSIKEMQAQQNIISKEIDERSKLTNWEKLMIILGMDLGGLAKNRCAKLNHIDKKHITNNIYPKISPTENHTENKHHQYLSWFKCITIKLDGKSHTLDISRWFDEQIERKKLQLEFEPLILVNNRVE